jgi:hypothetical protein
VTGRRQHDRLVAPGVEPAGAITPELLAGEDRRVEDRRGSARLRGGPEDREGDGTQQETREDDDDETARAEP